MQSLDKLVLFLFELGNLGFNFHTFAVFFQNTVDQAVTGTVSALSMFLKSVKDSVKLTIAFRSSASSFYLLIISLMLLFLAASASLCFVIIIAFLADSSFNL